MQVNVKNMKAFLEQLNRVLSNYEDDLRNFYHDLINVSNIWQDPHSEKFFKEINIEKVKLETSVDEIKSIRDIYKYLVASYESIGKKIEFDLNKRSSIINKIDNYQNKLERVINKYDRLDLSFCGSEKYRLRNERDRLKKELQDTKIRREKIQKMFLKIEEIESEIHLKLSRIDLEILKEKDVKEFM